MGVHTVIRTAAGSLWRMKLAMRAGDENPGEHVGPCACGGGKFASGEPFVRVAIEEGASECRAGGNGADAPGGVALGETGEDRFFGALLPGPRGDNGRGGEKRAGDGEEQGGGGPEKAELRTEQSAGSELLRKERGEEIER